MEINFFFPNKVFITTYDNNLSDHKHNVPISLQDIIKLKKGTSVNISTESKNNHQHQISITCSKCSNILFL